VHTRSLKLLDYHHPDAQRLIGEVQQEYVLRYGGPDDSPVDVSEFSPPRGLFVVAYDGGEPVAMGGWRLFDLAVSPFAPALSATVNNAAQAAELKRMFVVPHARGRGHARAVLAFLEQSAAAAGATWLVLETGMKQPEAIELYHATGYVTVPPFGHYADQALSVHLGKRLAAAAGPLAPGSRSPLGG
jgi:GNAT superfamily N-acetyltransferase